MPEREQDTSERGAGGQSADTVVTVRNLRKTFRRADGTPVTAVDNVSLEVRLGEFIVLLGPSGCGKTTLLRCIAGLERPDSGEIHIHDKTMYSSDGGVEVPPQGRGLSMIFQSYALWPHMTAFDNVAYPLRSRRTPKKEIVQRVQATLELVGIPELAKQHPGDMSGGQQQRVALARSLVAGDDLILFDEPLSNVDAKVRDQLRFELLEMQREIAFSAIYVTHDQIEAMELAHRVAVMRTGRVTQVGTPLEIYERPDSLYVANFIGKTNELHGAVTAIGNGVDVTVTTAVGDIRAVGDGRLAVGDNAVIVFRPERCQFAVEPAAGMNNWEGDVRASIFLGSHTEHVIRVTDDIDMLVWRPDPRLLEQNQRVWLSLDPVDARALVIHGDGPINEDDSGTTAAS